MLAPLSVISEAAVLFQEIPVRDGTQQAHYGHAIAMDGDLLVVGARNSDSDETDAGIAFLYIFDGKFGFSVAIDSTFGQVQIGEPLCDSPLDHTGAVHTFDRSSGNVWSPLWTHGSHEAKNTGLAGCAVAADAGQLLWGEPGNTDPLLTPAQARSGPATTGTATELPPFVSRGHRNT